jgi:hypothetical protein
MLNKSEAPEHEPIYCIMNILNLTERNRITETYIRLFAASDCNGGGTTAAGKLNVRMFAFYL